MARTGLSTTFVEAVNSAQTSEVFVALLTLNHSDMSSPIRVSTDPAGTTSNGNSFPFFPLRLKLPDEEAEGGVLASLTVDGVDRRITEALRTIQGLPQVDLDIVLASDPDNIELTWPTFVLANGRYNHFRVEGDLVLEILDQEPFPSGRIDPAGFPGAF